MKRTLAMLLSVALIGSVVFAGSAAAFDIDIDQDVDQDADADTTQVQVGSQSNYAEQGDNQALVGTAGNSANQDNTNVQYADTEAENDADQEVDDNNLIEDNDLFDF